MTVRRRIAVITTSRADAGHLWWPIHDLDAHGGVDLRVIAAGSHLSGEFGRTVETLEERGIRVDETVECLISSDSDVGMAKTIGVATLGLADVLGRLRPDLVLLIADRYEILAPASVALALRIPIAHIEGGEVSQGAIDDAVRNAVTKLAHVHFATTRTAAERLVALGEESWRVHRSGAPSLDHLRRRDLPGREDVERRLGMPLVPPVVVAALHPVTVARETTREADAFFEALSRATAIEEGSLVFCWPNPDAGSRALAGRARALCATRERARLVVNLEPEYYWGLLATADVMVGNSSSAIMESSSLSLPAVDIGMRQQGRERARNVFHAAPAAREISARLAKALAPGFRASLTGLENPYGDGRASERIVEVLTSIPLDERLRIKAPCPLPR